MCIYIYILWLHFTLTSAVTVGIFTYLIIKTMSRLLGLLVKRYNWGKKSNLIFPYAVHPLDIHSWCEDREDFAFLTKTCRHVCVAAGFH